MVDIVKVRDSTQGSNGKVTACGSAEPCPAFHRIEDAALS